MDDALSRISRVRPYYPAPSADSQKTFDTKLYWLRTAVVVTTTVTTVAWTTFDCTRDVPEGATAVLIEIEYGKSAVANLSRLDFRRRANEQAVLGCSVTGIAASGLTGNHQVKVPILSTNKRRSFDYELTGNSFGTSLNVQILGYYR